MEFNEEFNIIDSVFQFKVGDIIQICEDGYWSNLGKIKDARAASVDLYNNNFTIDNKPVRVIRY